MKQTVTLTSRYGDIKGTLRVSRINDYNECIVSYRAACNLDRNMAGDYFPGLVIDRAEKRAYIEPVECNVCGQQYPRTMNTCPYCKD